MRVRAHLGAILLACAACGGSGQTEASSTPPPANNAGSAGGEEQTTAPTAAPPAGSSAAPTSQPQGALRLGHYSTAQGNEGFVLDQTGTIPLVRLDGTNDVWELSSSPGPLDSVELRNEEAHIWIRITRYHEVLFDGPNQNEGIDVVRDADAAPLRTGG